MKRITFVFILFSVFGLLYAQSHFEREIETKPGKSLKVDLNTGGSITINGWDKALVLVKSDLDKDDMADYKIDIDQSARGINIDVTYVGYGRGRGGVDLDIHVPGKYNLEIETMGGEITIKHVEGVIAGETMGGDVDLAKLKGAIELTTMGGDITVDDSELEGEVKTMGGDIEFMDVIGTVKGSSMGGDVIYRNIKKKAEKGKGKEIRISTMGGDINLDSAPAGANVNTMGGDIRVRSAAKFVKAKTMGGDIDIDEIDGGAKASTMGGDVTVTMVGDPDQGERDVDLSSMGGDIVLTLPKGMSIDFDIKLTYTERASRDYKITCDFPIEIKVSEDWDYSQGSARKYIFGTGTVAGGKNKIHIDTINGNIIIKKGSR